MRALDGMEAGVHLPQVEFAGEGFSLRRLADTVHAARANGFAAVSGNDHFLFGAPWLDGLTALAAVAERSEPMTLATTVSLAALAGRCAGQGGGHAGRLVWWPGGRRCGGPVEKRL